MTEDQIKHMVNRFLRWRLPDDFCPDGGISFKKTFNEHTAHPMKHEPSGTNLFDFTQAEAMVRYMIEGMPEIDLDLGALCDLVEYGDDHNWGNMPEGVIIERARAAAIKRTREKESMTDFRWLIEAPGQRYLTVRKLTSRHDFIWATDHNVALQFKSEEQADLMISALRDMDRKLFGFDETLGPARPVEHGWMALTDDCRTKRETTP